MLRDDSTPCVRRSHTRVRPLAAIAAVVLFCLCVVARASGPRWVTGPPYFTVGSRPVAWYTATPLYYTDPGDLSASVDHAAADALVAAAADIWNVPTAKLMLAQGGELAEHVSSANVYLGANGLVFPADVSSANYSAIQIAVIYDSDGSVTELLLGQGASDPENCRQNGVTETVDAITPVATIQHALLILNGRCTGPDPEQQWQMQYQLMRAFGRVIGLGWSQLNDNVFTDSPLPTSEETLKWPIMHPIDIVCGPYTYQCMPYPFTLRPDDIGSISQLYPIAKGSAAEGKVDTLSIANSITGTMSFVAGQGMQGMNLLVRRDDPITPYLETAPVVSAVTGSLFRRSNGNPVTGPGGATVDASMGSRNPPLEGEFQLGWIPMLPSMRQPDGLVKAQDIYITSEAINPLYIGEYSIGPYVSAPVTPSGPAFPWRDNDVKPYESNYYPWSVPGSATTCAASDLGSASAPVAVNASGWWTNVLCGYGVSAFPVVSVQANRNLSVEVTALDEQGQVTENKLQPLIGVWTLSDSTGLLPTVAAAVSPFNSIAAGLTLVNFDAPGAGPLRMAITDQRGDGRPDYNFRARVLYADSISPTAVTLDGGLVTITGMGFRAGMQVTVGGVLAQVVSATQTSMLAIAPPFAELPPGTALMVDVRVSDPMSGGSTAMYGALSYPAIAIGPGNAATVLTPKFYVAAGQTVALAPQVSLSAAGVAAAGVPVTWSSVSGAFSLANGGQSVSDANGVATIAASVGPLSPSGQAAGSACAWTSVCGSFSAIGVDPSLWTVTAIQGIGQSLSVPTSAATVLQPVVFQITDGAGDPVIGVPVAVYQAVTGFVVCPEEGRCPIAPVYQSSQTSAVSDANGLVVVTPLQMAGAPEVTTIAVTAGMQGFLSVPLQKTP